MQIYCTIIYKSQSQSAILFSFEWKNKGNDCYCIELLIIAKVSKGMEVEEIKGEKERY